MNQEEDFSLNSELYQPFNNSSSTLQPTEFFNSTTSGYFEHYAPPDIWGTWKSILNHVGDDNTYSITYEAVGDTLVYAEVKYFSFDEKETKIDYFFKEATIHVGKSVGPIDIRFKGVPLGSAVRGWIN